MLAGAYRPDVRRDTNLDASADVGPPRTPPAVCCLLVDVDAFLSRAADAPDGWAERTRRSLDRMIAGHARGLGDARVEHLPPDEWLLTLSSPAADDLERRAREVAAGIHRAARHTADVTVTVAIGAPVAVTGADADAVAVATSSARQAHRAKLALGPDRVIPASAPSPGDVTAGHPSRSGQSPPDARAPHDAHREVARAIGRGESDRARRLLCDWFAAATAQASGDDELVRRWLLGQVLATTATLDGRLGVGTAADWMAVCEAVPYAALTELADLHEPGAVVAWVERVVDALALRHRRGLTRSPTLELIRRHVDEHFTDPDLRLKRVAATVGVSPFHVSHLFRSELGTTFRDYVTQRRVRRAQRLLEETRLGMAQVARASGFGTPVQLRRVLVRETGATPSETRRSAHSQP
ncbi:helix-turn-helix transcriptional regulator [Phytoactinopolyspora halotolerans]|uniref:Helix-turn-helix transcriptional regulator n=1 Tax=Phytoactinopolyspora halotolerans TaxID=1981512 RepID=A0A6L9SCK7_9ACTN|nr:AraC family transcriptional regulator [Phytoactinopolyspora halotolerans]NEE02308.1 helix-turn-helix transcriptional regulator [Phytoactinopolyspora halotolerans]